jgi:hypothetical protein
VRNHAFEIDKEKLKVSKVVKHVSNRNREKTQQNHKKKCNKEVPPKSK